MFSTKIWILLLTLLLFWKSQILIGADDNLIQDLISAVDARDISKARQIAQTVIEKKNEFIPELKLGLNSQDSVVRNYFVMILSKIQTDESTDLLLHAACNDTFTTSSRQALQALLWRHDIDLPVEPRILNCIIEKHLAQDSGMFEKAWTARILGRMKQADIQLRVSTLLVSLHRQVLAESDVKLSAELLQNSYGTKSQYLIRQIVFALHDIGPEAIPGLEKALDGISDTSYTDYLRICMGSAGDELITPDLITILNSAEDGEKRALAAIVLGDLKDNSSLPYLQKALLDTYIVNFGTDAGHDEIYPVREAAFEALDKKGIPVERSGNRFWLKN